ncbi:MAG: hypothetical protein ACK4OI_07340, partial [Rhizobium oryzihabitans]
TAGKEEGKREEGERKAACRISHDRIKGGFARLRPALDPVERNAGGPEGVLRDRRKRAGSR